jgi:hypothetical protein
MAGPTGRCAVHAQPKKSSKPRRLISSKHETNCQGKDWDESARSRHFSSARGKALHRGHSWEISKEEFYVLSEKPCMYCQRTPGRLAFDDRRRGQYVYNGIDRVDNSRGYVTGNVVPCCTTCNMAKRDKTLEQFMAMIERIVRHRVCQDRCRHESGARR